MIDNKRRLYDALSQDYDMGSFDQFVNDIQDEAKRKKLYNAISGEYDLGAYDAFSKQLMGGTKKSAEVDSIDSIGAIVGDSSVMADEVGATSAVKSVADENTGVNDLSGNAGAYSFGSLYGDKPHMFEEMYGGKKKNDEGLTLTDGRGTQNVERGMVNEKKGQKSASIDAIDAIGAESTEASPSEAEKGGEDYLEGLRRRESELKNEVAGLESEAYKQYMGQFKKGGAAGFSETPYYNEELKQANEELDEVRQARIDAGDPEIKSELLLEDIKQLEAKRAKSKTHVGGYGFRAGETEKFTLEDKIELANKKKEYFATLPPRDRVVAELADLNQQLKDSRPEDRMVLKLARDKKQEEYNKIFAEEISANQQAAIEKTKEVSEWAKPLAEEAIEDTYKKSEDLFDPRYLAAGHNPFATAEMRDHANYNQARRVLYNIEVAQELIANAERIAAGQGFFRGSWEGFKDHIADRKTWENLIDPVNAVASSFDIANVYKKYQKEGEDSLTDLEKAVLDSEAMRLAVVEHIGSGKWSDGYTVGQGVSESIPFMVEMAISAMLGGTPSAAKSMSLGVLKRYAQRYGTKEAVEKFTKETAKNVGKAYGYGAVQTATIGVPGLIKGANERNQGQVLYDEELNRYGIKEGDSYGKALAKEFLAGTIERGVEMTPGIEPVSDIIGVGLKKASPKVVREAIDRISGSEWAKRVGDFEKKAQWHGVLGEYVEEIRTGLLNMALVGDEEWDKFWTVDNQMNLFLTTSMIGGTMSGVKSLGYQSEAKAAQKQADKMNTQMREAFGSDWEMIEKQLRDPQLAVGMLTDMKDGGYSRRQIQLAMQYAGLRAKEIGGELAEEKLRELNPVVAEAHTSYDSGNNAVDVEQKAEVEESFEKADAAMREVYGENDMALLEGDNFIEVANQFVNAGADPQLIQNYINARSAREGMMDRIGTEIEDAGAASDAQIDKETNPQTKTVQAVELSDGRKGHVMAGSVALREDGSVDTHATSKNLVVSVDGKLEFVPVNMLSSASAPVDASAYKAQRRSEIEAEHLEATDKAVEEVRRRNMAEEAVETHGDALIRDEDGTIDEVEVSPGFSEGTVNVTYKSNGKTVQMGYDAYVGLYMGRPQVKADEAKGGQDVQNAHEGQDDVASATEVPATEVPVAEGTTQQQQGAQVSAPSASWAVAPQEGASALSRVPKNENGEAMYTQTDADTAWDAILEETGNDEALAQDVANSMLADAQKNLKAAEKQRGKSGGSVSDKIARAKAVAAAQADVDAWARIADTSNRRRKDAEHQQRVEAEAAQAQRLAEAQEQRAQTEGENVGNAQEQATETKVKEFSDWVTKVSEVAARNAARWGNLLNVDIRVHTDVSSITNGKVRERIQVGDIVDGWYEPSTGEVHVYIPGVVQRSLYETALGRSEHPLDRLEKTIRHEVGVHKAMRETLGEKFDDYMLSVWNRMSEAQKEEFIKYVGGDRNNRESQIAAADEYLASVSENTEPSTRELSMFEGFVKTVADFFRGVFGKPKEYRLEDEARDIIRANYAYMKEQGEAKEEKKAEAVRISEKRKGSKNLHNVAEGDTFKNHAAGKDAVAVVTKKSEGGYEVSHASTEADAKNGKFTAKEVMTEEAIQQLVADGTFEVVEKEKDGTKIDNDVASIEGGNAMFSIRTYREQGRGILSNYVNERVKSGELTESEGGDILKQMDDIYETCLAYRDVYAPFGQWSEAEVAMDEQGKPVFTVVKPNGDYAMNLDFSLVCKKRRTLDAVFREMIDRGIISNYEMGQVDVAKINDIIRRYGFETACRLCFVDAKRFRVAQVSDVFCEMYNPLTKMSDVQLKKISKKAGNTVPGKIARMLIAHPENRVELSRDNFMDSKGFEDMSVNKAEIMKLYNAKKGTGGPKASYGDTQYLNDILGKNWTPEAAYAVGGVRLQSFSDYVPRMVFDYIQMVADLAAKGLPVHAYTKEELFAKTFGLTGMKINLSLVPSVVTDGVAPGLDANGDYVWQEGETFPYDIAMELQSAEGYKENVGTIAVGVSDEHILKLLRDDNIRMVIPYHSSGLNKQVAVHNNIDKFVDYTKVQNTRNSNGNSLTKAQKKSHFDYNADLHKHGNPRLAAQHYLEWCDKKGYIPKFDKFRNEPNYYKLLEDFTTCITENGADTFVPQREVRMDFPKEGSPFGSLTELIERGLDEDAVLEGRRQEKIGEIVDAIEDEFGKDVLEAPKKTLFSAVESPAEILERLWNEDVAKQIAEEEAQIVAEAQKNGTYLKAPNGNDTNLSPEQWARVRTKRFKNWFGDWEKEARIQKLRESEPVTVEYDNEYELNRDSAKQWMKENLRGEYTNKDTNEVITISKVGINEVTSHGAQDDIHLKSLSAIPQMIEQSIFIEELANSKGHDKYDSYRYYVCGLKVDGVDYTAKIVVGVKNGSKYYDHRLTQIEKGTLIESLNGLSNSVASNQNASVSIGKDTKLISLLQNNSSKIVDENGEPMVVYHGGTFAVDNFVPNARMHFGTKKAALQRVLDEGYGYDEWQVIANEDGTYSWKYEDSNDANYDKQSSSTFATEEEAMEDAVKQMDGDVVISSSFLNIRNLERTDDANNSWDDTIEAVKDENPNVDGIVYENWYEDKGSDSYIAINPNQIKSATDNVGTYSNGSDDIRFSFIGEKGAKALGMLDNLSVAREMEDAGKDALAIKMATGWERGADGKWRYEIADADFVGSPIDFRGTNKLGEVCELGDLGKAYPELKNYPLRVNERLVNGGKFDGKTITINIGELKDAYAQRLGREGVYVRPKQYRNNVEWYEGALAEARGTLVHEIQHAIQRIEGFARGGSSSMPKPGYTERIKALYAEAKEAIDKYNNAPLSLRPSLKDEAIRKRNEYNKAKKSASLGIEGYKRLAGEVEAKNVTERLNKSAKWRREHLAIETEDVAREDQIFIFGSPINAEVQSKNDIRFSFIGEQGAAQLDKAEEATTRLDNLNVAREMEAQDKDASSIKMATGWERGADGKWRYEVMDYVDMFDMSGYVDYKRRHPEYARYKELQRKRARFFFYGTEPLTDEEQKFLNENADIYKDSKINNSSKLKDYLNHDELFKAYPDLKNIKVEFVDFKDGWTKGTYIPSTNTIAISNGISRQEAASVMFHEVQHAIQVREGFAKGANPNAISPERVAQRKAYLEEIDRQTEEVNQLIRQYYNELDKVEEAGEKWYEEHPQATPEEDEAHREEVAKQISSIRKEINNQDEMLAFLKDAREGTKSWNMSLGEDGYWRTAGEVESRNVQKRLSMTPEERRASLHTETQDVADEDQIFIHDALESAMGSRVDKRMADIDKHFKGAGLTERQRAIVDVFGGVRNNLPITIERADGGTRRVVMRQGREDRGGTKHALLRHYGTSSGNYTADELLLIEDVLSVEPTHKQRRGVTVNVYQREIDGVRYTVVTEKKDNREEFTDFYTNRSGDTRSLNTQLSARAGHTTASSEREVTTNSVTEQNNGQENESVGENSYLEEGAVRFSVVTDPKEIARLDGEKTRTLYRSMALIDGKLYPPMSSMIDGKLREPIEIGQWEKAEERSDLAYEKNGKWYFDLVKDNGKAVRKVAYNPYIHTSSGMLNDQFAEAQDRPNLVTVAIEVPESELNGSYKAEKAHDATGLKSKWKAGPVTGKMKGTRGVYLSQHGKVTRIVPDSEVAKNIAEELGETFEKLPTNVFTPGVRAELEKLGYEFVETTNKGELKEGKRKGETWASVYGSKKAKKAATASQRAGQTMFSSVPGSLVATHNLTASNLDHVVKMGGIANPSMAVVNSDITVLDNFGEITLIAPRELIDKKTGKNAGTWTGDSWTPTYPNVKKQLDNKGWKKINSFIDGVVEDPTMRSDMRYGVEMYLDGQDGYSMKYAFLKDKGVAIDLVRKTNEGNITDEEFKELVGVDAQTAMNGSYEEYERFKQLPQEIQDEFALWVIANGNKKKIAEIKQKIQDNKAYEKIYRVDVPFSTFNSFAYDTYRKERYKGKVDTRATLREADNYIALNGLSEEYRNWMDNLLQEAGAKEVIFNGYDNNGRAKYMPHTLENVSKKMKKDGKANAYSDTGYGATRAMLLTKLSSIDQIRKHKQLLSASSEHVEEVHKELSDRLLELVSDLSDMEKISSNRFMNMDYANKRLQEALMSKSPVRYLNEEYGYNIDYDSTFAEDLRDFIADVKSAPVRYFETKFERPVMLNEFVGAIIPENASERTRKILDEAGIPYKTYNQEVEGDRKQVTKDYTKELDEEVGGVRFSRIEAPSMVGLVSNLEARGIKVEFNDDTNVFGVRCSIGDGVLRINPNATIDNRFLNNVLSEAVWLTGFEKLIGEDNAEQFFTEFTTDVFNDIAEEPEMKALLAEHGYSVRDAVLTVLSNINTEINHNFLNDSLLAFEQSGIGMYIMNRLGEFFGREFGVTEIESYTANSMLAMVGRPSVGNITVVDKLHTISQRWLSERARRAPEVGTQEQQQDVSETLPTEGTSQGANGGGQVPPTVGGGANISSVSVDAITRKKIDAVREIAPLRIVRKVYDAAVATTGKTNMLAGLWWAITHVDEGGFRAFKNDLAEGWFDYARSVRQLQKALEDATGGKLEDVENVWQAIVTSSSRGADEIMKAQRDFKLPLVKVVADIMKKHGYTLAEVEKYLYCKHGLERNQVMGLRAYEDNLNQVKERIKRKHAEELAGKTEAEANAFLEPLYEEAEKKARRALSKDYSGLTELLKVSSFSRLTEEAKRVVEAFENKVGDDVTTLWEGVKKLTDYALKKDYDSGLIGKDLYHDVMSMYQNYVPLRGWANDAAADVYTYHTDSLNGEARLQSSLKKAYGRTSQAKDIFGHILSMVDSSIIAGNKNQVKQRLLFLAQNHPSDVLMVSDVWYVRDASGKISAAYPEINDDMSAEEAQEAIAEFDERMKEAEKAGEAKRYKADFGKEIGLHMRPYEEKMHGVRVTVNGKEKIVWVVGNPKAAMALNGFLTEADRSTIWSDIMHKLLRFQNMANTSLNPEFVVGNAERDFLTTLSSAFIKRGSKFAGKWLGHMLRVNPLISWATKKHVNMFKLMHRYNNGTLDMNNPTERMFHEFASNGGITGITQMNDVSEYANAFSSDVNIRNSKVKRAGAAAWEFIWGGIEWMNNSVENAARFATYMTARESGESVMNAVTDAKENSVNFNVRGSGAWGNAYVRKYIAFANAALQGTRLVNEWWNASKGKTAFVMASYMTMGALQALILSSFFDGDDDDEEEGNERDWYGLSDFNRYNFFNVPGSNGGWWRYSIPHEFRAPFTVGQVAVDLMNGKLKFEKAIAILATLPQNYSPISIIEGGTNYGDMDDMLWGVAKGFAPAIGVKDALDIMHNKDFLGRPIHNRSDFNELDPEWQRVTDRTSETLVGISRGFNEFFGGRRNRRGPFESVLNNPAVWDYVLMQRIGGAGGFIRKLWTSSEAVVKGKTDELDYRDIPFVKTFWVPGNTDKTFNYMTSEDFYSYMDMWNNVDHEVKKNLQDEGTSVPYKLNSLAEMEEDGELVEYFRFTPYKKKHEDYQRAIDNAEAEGWDDEVQVLKQKQKDNMLEALGKMHDPKTPDEDLMVRAERERVEVAPYLKQLKDIQRMLNREDGKSDQEKNQGYIDKLNAELEILEGDTAMYSRATIYEEYEDYKREWENALKNGDADEAEYCRKMMLNGARLMK